MSIPMIGLDLAKTIFHVHGIDASGTVVLRRSLRRGQVERFFAALSPCVVEMEGVWRIAPLGRLLQRLGHAVRMMPAHYVKPSVKRNKTDGRDAEAICEAASRPTIRRTRCGPGSPSSASSPPRAKPDWMRC